MNKENQADNTKKPETGLSIDTKPQAKIQSNAAGKIQGKAKTSSGRGWRVLSLFLLLVILVGGGVLGWFGQKLWLERSSITQATTQQAMLIQTLQQNIDQASSEQSMLVVAVERKLEALQKELRHQIALAESSDGDGVEYDKILLDEAEFLIRLANQRLLVERRPEGAQVLLKSADQVLVKLDDPGLLPLRKTLAENIAELRQTSIVDREGLYLRIGVLSELMMTFSALPSHGLEMGQDLHDGSVGEESATTVVLDAPWYQRLLKNIGSAAKDFVNQHFYVRSLEQPLVPLMPVDKETQLRHRLFIDLSNAQQAVLREETNIYRASLARAAKDVRQYFALNNEVQAVIDQLNELQLEVVEQQLPDISASLYALRDYRASGESQFDHGED